ncbi:MAG: sugar phosphate nucleotidyltransferase [Eubacteriales bacterium]|nr:sugar phosphate nucleotidyltransferase [Eubacteriales bacterium]
MQKPTLVVMAAGIGSRFGGLKQIEPIGPNGEMIIDYAIYDAAKAGFAKVVFIIKDEIAELFKEKVGNRISQHIPVSYAFQRVDSLPSGFKVPEGRTKPWGTAQAVLSSAEMVDTPFAVINADDFYGRNSYNVLCDFLKGVNDNSAQDYCMVGFVLGNTLTENGHVARGECRVDNSGNLTGITERTKIIKTKSGASFSEDGEGWADIPVETTVSMNMWGFTPSIFNEIWERFPRFLADNKERLDKAEFFLPSVVDSLIREGKAVVKVLKTDEKWFGVTYKEDKINVMESIKDMVEKGVYPSPIWG